MLENRETRLGEQASTATYMHDMHDALVVDGHVLVLLVTLVGEGDMRVLLVAVLLQCNLRRRPHPKSRQRGVNCMTD